MAKKSDSALVIDEESIKIIQAKFDSLQFKQQKSTYRYALNAAATILQKQTDLNVKMIGFKARNRAPKKNQASAHDRGVCIHSTPTHKRVVLKSVKNAKSFVRLYGWARLLEGGTLKARMTAKGANRGSVKGYKFFESARKMTERKVFDTINSNIYKAIDKRWKNNNKKSDV